MRTCPNARGTAAETIPNNLRVTACVHPRTDRDRIDIMKTTNISPVTQIDPVALFVSPFASLMPLEKQMDYIPIKRQEGRVSALEGLHMHVGANGHYWYVDPNSSRIVETYERIGYHTLAEQVLVGFLGTSDSVCYFHGFHGIVGRVSL